MLAGAGRLDGGVEREQVGLVGDAGDGAHDVADAGGLALQLHDHLDGSRLAVRGGPDAGDAAGDLMAHVADEAAQRVRLLARHVGGALGLQKPGVDLGDRAAGLLGAGGGLLGAGGDRFHGLAQFFRGGRGLRDAGRELVGGGGDALGRLLLPGVGPHGLAVLRRDARKAGHGGGIGRLRRSGFDLRLLRESHGRFFPVRRRWPPTGGASACGLGFVSLPRAPLSSG